jgi:uncharacterized spore protein YtfJ
MPQKLGGKRLMEAEIQELLDTFADLREKADVNTCFGAPVTVEGRTVIPIAKVAYGFGMGVGRGIATEEENPEETSDGTGGGGAGGVMAHPLAAIEVTSEGVLVDPIIDKQKVALAGILLSGWLVFWLAQVLIRIFGQRE